MSKLSWFYLAIACCTSLSVQSQQLDQVLLEIKGGYFIFSNENVRKIYNGGSSVQLSSTLPIMTWSDRYAVDLYGSVGYLYCSGRSLSDHQKTSLWQLPVDVGIKPVFLLHPKLQYYVAVGPRYFYIHQHNDSAYVFKNQGQNGFGFFVNTGFYYLFSQHLTLDVLGEYFYGKIHFHDKEPLYYTQSVQVGGYTIGAGVGYAF